MKTYCSDCGKQTDATAFPFLASLCLDCLWKFKKTFQPEEATGCSTTQPA